MRPLFTFLLTAAQAVGIKLLGPLLVGLLVFGVAPASFVWAAVVLFLINLTVLGVLKLRAFKNPPWKAFGSEKAKVAGQENFDAAHPLPEFSWIVAERRDAVMEIFSSWLALPALLFAVWAWSEPVVGWYHTLHLPTALVMAIGIFLLGWPDRESRWKAEKRTRVRSAMVGVVVVVAAASLCLRHPYLLPGYPDATRVRAERVLAAGSIVTMQHHAGALVAYALELEQAGQIQKAGDLLNLASRCDGTNPEIQETFADFLKRHGRPGEDAVYRKLAADLRSGEALKISDAGYDLDHATPLPVFAGNIPGGHAVVLVADRNTPTVLLDLVGSVLRTELGVAVYRHPTVVDIEATSRGRGLASKQISIEDAWKEASAQLEAQRTGPHQFLVVTSRDLFAPGANFLYSSPTSPGNGIVSYARLGSVKSPATNRKLLDSLCKQAISTVIKSLIIYPSPDPRDVTAYVNGAFQLSRKGRRPLPTTLASYREQIRRWSDGIKRNPRAAR